MKNGLIWQTRNNATVASLLHPLRMPLSLVKTRNVALLHVFEIKEKDRSYGPLKWDIQSGSHLCCFYSVTLRHRFQTQIPSGYKVLRALACGPGPFSLPVRAS